MRRGQGVKMLRAVLDAPRHNASWEACRFRGGPGYGSNVCPQPVGYYSTPAVFVQQFLFFYQTYSVEPHKLRLHTLSEGARPTQERVCLSRMRRRDMSILCASGVGSSVSDSVRLVSMPTTRSSAVLRCRVRIGGRLKVCEFALLRAS